MRILIVEDDDRIAQPLAEDLKHEQHHVVDVASDGIEGWEYACSAEYELILLDLMLPKLDGITLCKRLRSAQCNALILMLTALDTTSDKVVGLDAGADDYLVKPFDLEELAARIRALSRRNSEIKQVILSNGDLQINPISCTVTYASKEISLTPKEYMILECFLKNKNQILNRSQILEKLWNSDKFSGEETIKTHITNIRRKLKAVGDSEDMIETVYGIGYRLNAK